MGNWLPSANYIVGSIGDATAPDGSTKKVVYPGAVIMDPTTGNALGTAANPLEVSSSGGGGGAVTVADGADVAQGAIANAAYVSGSGTVVSILKGIFGKLPVSLGEKTGATSLSVVPATDATFPSTIGNRAMYWAETSTPLAASATFTGPTRDLGAAVPAPYSYVNAAITTDQVGTARIERSNNGTTWVPYAPAPIVADTPLTLQVPVVGRYFRIVVENGGTPQTDLDVNFSFTAS